MNDNPLLVNSGNPFGAPAFDRIENRHYVPAFEQALAQARSEVDAIIGNAAEPDFENTVLALERCGKQLNAVEEIFFNLNEACTDDEMQEIAEQMAPKLTEFGMYVSLNEELFARIKAVYDRRDSLGLNKEDLRLLTEAYKSYARNGANLPKEDKAAFGKLSEELSVASLRFGKNTLGATNAYTLDISAEEDLEGLPDFVREAAAAEAASRGKEGWTITLNHPSYVPFMQYSSRRDLRQQLWMAYNTRCIADKFDNDANIHQIVDLSTRKARMLGYGTYADYATEDRMAKNKETVNRFVGEMMAKCLPYARRDVADLQEYARSHGFEGELMPWDFAYWSEKLRTEKYSVNDELLKPYFQLENVRDAIFGLAGTLYGLSFVRREDIPVYHPDVQVYEVRDGARFMGLLYMDFFPRESKRGGAWMTSFRDLSIENGVETRPLIQLVTNFSKPTADTPSLLTHDEVTTFLHEFGHCLHGLLAEGSYASLTGTSVARDFVELPSQFMENWAFEPQWLNSFARHYKTGEAIPQDLIDKLVAAKNFQAGYAFVRQLQFGTLDMAWYTSETVPAENAVDFEHKVLASTAVMPVIQGVAISPQFTHIFSGGYAAGYYSYKWAEVLEADAFSLFKEKGIFNKEAAAAFRENILSKGNLEDADVLYRNFRGRDPRPEALLEQNGLTERTK
ncbi:MAG: M3 family metallopeptidase [Bacteroidales bacterium]|nr:M3 family metallopeptidase [Bacteroidales bacterium]